VDVGGGCDDELCVAAGAVDSEDLQLGAAVGLAAAAGVAGSAAEERLDDDELADGETGNAGVGNAWAADPWPVDVGPVDVGAVGVGAEGLDVPCDFVSGDDGVGGVGVFALVDLEVFRADAGCADGDADFAGSRDGEVGGGFDAGVAGGANHESLHASPRVVRVATA